jgi:hypothetical protein
MTKRQAVQITTRGVEEGIALCPWVDRTGELGEPGQVGGGNAVEAIRKQEALVGLEHDQASEVMPIFVEGGIFENLPLVPLNPLLNVGSDGEHPPLIGGHHHQCRLSKSHSHGSVPFVRRLWMAADTDQLAGAPGPERRLVTVRTGRRLPHYLAFLVILALSVYLVFSTTTSISLMYMNRSKWAQRVKWALWAKWVRKSGGWGDDRKGQ